MPAHDDLPRTTLPMPDRPKPGLTTYHARDPDTSFAPITPVRPPTGAPNVLVILLDDVGFGASSVFGGPVDTPVAQRLADGGLRYNRFHTTALCSPTRQALLTGRNHHSVGMGAITELATSAPGYSTIRPNSKAPLAETLRLNGYATAQLGKCHEVPVWETSPAGPFDRWPTGSGFEYFYGFIGAETNQYYPTLYHGTTPVKPTRTPEEGYHLTEDLADRGVDWIRRQHALQPDRPFFMYFAPGATHSPHHAPKQWCDRYAGRFDAGWDALREEIFERQKELGVIPPDAVLTAFNPEIPHWDGMPDDLKPVLARQMEVYAGFLAHTDDQIGRLVQALDDLELLDNTLIYYIIGDNGASAEGAMHGTFNGSINYNGMGALETPEFLRARMDELGTPSSYNHFAVGWAHALSTPYQWTKQVASHWGGTRNGTIVHWPARITAAGELREQFAHVIDVAPTILEAAGLPEPTTVHGVTQAPIEGVSMRYTFSDGAASERHQTQYFEIGGNRGIYHRGWTAVTRHRTPWLLLGAQLAAFDDDVWELYGPEDWTQSRDLAAEQPDMLHRLQRLWLIEATKHGVLPLDDRGAERFNPDLAGRPQLIRGNTQVLFPGMGHLNENSVINIKNKSHAVTAQVVVPDAGAEGVIIAQGGMAGGWSLYAREGRLRYCYNLVGLRHFYIDSDVEIPAGEHQVRVEFAYAGPGLAKGGTVTLHLDGVEVGRGTVSATQPVMFSADEATHVGRESGSTVTPEYPARGNDFSGTIRWVQIDVDAEAANAEHLIPIEERWRVAMARQ
ncbi:sulfatase-like hydrolase/transferase [Micromonospora chaiyaphumensis]|uniref:Arylsulfatase n=1 Tax=Micromonospora chaiyaphumensis TaxID=307119 RepID=A0A1C4W522_9ACTN|nr:arylsulfatase [Micromonospora chaiyaphumensis]SCE91258.1 arylsulfatase [Micromonospora chaiyaphumensis]